MGALIDTIRYNCDIADARHGADFGMCAYLMKMRELYRWERGLPLGASLGKDEVGDWLADRERRLDRLAGEDFRAIPFDGERLDPFDTEGVNRRLGDRRLVYSAGLVDAGRPHFFLAELEGEQRSGDGFHLRVCGRELARCLNAPPAMTLGMTIFLRRESLRRYLWEKYEAWSWHRPHNAMARVADHYGFDRDLDAALDRMSEAEMAVIEAHEQGEYQAGLVLGDGWERMLTHLTPTPAELMARAVRDHLADCTHTLPMLIDAGREPSLHFYAANLGGMRAAIFPALMPAYRDWAESGRIDGLRELVGRGARHWLRLAQRLIEIHRTARQDPAPAIAQAVETAHL